MNGVTGAAGVTDVQARISSIRARIGQLSPQPPGTNRTFTLGSPGDGTVGAPSGPVVGAPPGAAAPAASPVGGTAPVAGVPSGTTSGGDVSAAEARLAQVLPDAGKRWAGPIAQAAEKHGLDPGLLAALVRHESNFDPNARSHAGAIGLGQLMPGTAAGLGVDPTDPQQNLDGAARYLKQQLDRFGSADLALAAYNAGPNRVAQAGGVPNITETRTYVDRVLTTWEQYR